MPPRRLAARASARGIGAQVATACRILAHERLVAAFGHVSARVPGTRRLIVSPRAAPGASTARSLLLVDLDEGVRRGARPPLELPIHTAIYRQMPEVGSVCRIHGEAALILSVLDQPVRPAHVLGSLLGREVPVHDEGDLIADTARGEAVVRALRGHAALLLRGNGQVVVGTTLAEACVRAIYLEEAARVQLRAMPLGQPRYYTAEELEAFRLVWEDPINVERAWRYYAGLVTGR